MRIQDLGWKKFGSVINIRIRNTDWMTGCLKQQVPITVLYTVTLRQVLGLTGGLKQLPKARRDAIEKLQAGKTIL